MLVSAPASPPPRRATTGLRAAVALMLDAGLGAGRAAELAAALGARRNRAYRAALAEAEERRDAT